MEEIFMEKKLFKRSLTFAMMIAVVFSTYNCKFIY